MPKQQSPAPLFDSFTESDTELYNADQLLHQADYMHARNFLQAYNGSRATFNSYRREVERLIQWSWLRAQKSILELRRQDIEDYLNFCQQPPKSWIGTKKNTRFITKQGLRVTNPDWKPFVVTVSKAEHRNGAVASVDDYKLSHSALRDAFSILSSFYNYLTQEEVTDINPVANIRQKSKFLRRQQGKRKIRRLTEKQWRYLIDTTERLADQQPEKHERSLFIMSALFAMYLRISELASSERWTPTMNDFWQDHDGNWWFTTVGKGNKERQITVSNDMLAALKRWRQHLGLTALPSPSDQAALISKIRGQGPVTCVTYLREIVQHCFDHASEELMADGHQSEADNLIEATVHWLRHTGISEDVKIRPREHVRDDAGHSSGAITDGYIDIELNERHASGEHKPMRNK